MNEKITFPYELHLFICTNQNEKGANCAQKGSLALRADLKAWSREKRLTQRLRVNSSGCLGQCENGIACVFYPKTKWLINVAPGDIESLKTEILAALEPAPTAKS